MSNFIKTYVQQEKISRRNLLLATAAGLTATAMPRAFGPGAAMADSGGWALAWSYRDRASAYWNAIVSGGEAYTESLGLKKEDMTNLINEGSSEKIPRRHQGLPRQERRQGRDRLRCQRQPERPPCGGSRARCRRLHLDHLEQDRRSPPVGHRRQLRRPYLLVWREASAEAAKILFDAMGGEGGVVHLGGIPANIPAIERLNGLKVAMKDYPKIELLDSQPADWDTTKAAELMSSYLTKYGDKIKGVHCANDNMAYGVLQALKAKASTSRSRPSTEIPKRSTW